MNLYKIRNETNIFDSLKNFIRNNKIKNKNKVHIDCDLIKSPNPIYNPDYSERSQSNLSRYGIESNPGPSLKTIFEHVESNPGVYTFCNNCNNINKVAESSEQYVIYLHNCFECFRYHAQAWLSDGANNDINQKINSISNWMMNGNLHGKSMISAYIKIPAKFDKYVNLIEDILILTHGLLTSKSTFDRYIAVTNFCKLRGSRFSFTMVVGQVFADIFGSYIAKNKKENQLYDNLHKHVMEQTYEAQDEEEEESLLESFRKYINMYDTIKHTALFKKVQKFTFYLLSLGLLEGVNIDFKSLNYTKAEEAAIRKSHRPGFDMIHNFLDTITFLCDRGIQFFKSGDYDVLFHSGSSYEKWLGSAHALIKSSKLMHNPEAHGLNKFKFISELKDTIEKGKAIVKFTHNMDRAEKLYVQKVLNDLQLIEADELTKKAAQEPREDPFAVLLHGASNICKSQLKEILFLHYAKVFGLPYGDEYKYTRCPSDEYWSGFSTSMWAIIMDDIGWLKPNGDPDPSLTEMLQVKNSVPYTPPQAALEDKGRTPIRAKLLIATTNTKDLNLHAYFSCPFAIARRLSYIITAHVKPEYTKLGFMADSKKIPITENGRYMNIWRFEISIPVPESDEARDNQRTKYKTIAIYEDIDDMLAWYISAAKEHAEAQKKASSAHLSMKAVEVCLDCYRNKLSCNCGESVKENYFGNCCQECLNEPCTCAMCQQCLSSPCECKYTSQAVETSDFTTYYKFKLYLLEKIISGNCNRLPDRVHDFLDDWDEFINDYYKHMLWALLFTTVWTWKPIILCILIAIGMYSYVYFFTALHYICESWGGSFWKYHLAYRLLGCEAQTWKLIFRLVGDRVEQINFNSDHLKKFGMFISSATVLACIYKFLNRNKSFESQGFTGSVPVSNEIEKKTFYYQDPYKVTDVEISGASKCAPSDIIKKHVIRNTARFIIRFDNLTVTRSTTAVNIKGNIWMLNSHVFKENNSGVMDIILEDVNQNVSRNTKNVRFVKESLYFLPDTDLAFIQLRCMAPGPDLTKYFPLDKILDGCYRGVYYMIDKTGARSEKELANIRKGKDPVHHVLAYNAVVLHPTSGGDCGTLCVAEIGQSHVILGSHVSGNGLNGVYFQHISQKMINNALGKYEAQVDAGSLPISAPGYERKLLPLHNKSTLRWIEHGTANILGSFDGYRPKHKSKVKDTFIKDAAVAQGYKANYGQPDMSYKPWHLALNDMTSPNHSYREDILLECENAFLNDIFTELGDKIKQLQIYTQDVALNGVDGVTFVDRLNVSTSAGNPFKKSKKHFINLDENNHITSLDPVIQSRIDEIEETYKRGQRFNPQFCGHLKDEPTSTAKIAAGKTRVFTGGEFAWSVVVRKFLLSHIRLIQNNPYVFEAMPGIVAQSKEWEELYDYLTYFGKDRMIAGDYGKFDKRMAAPFILSAFRILERMAIKAGWSEEETRVIKCIAQDVAFANIDFNGDLIEIQGNPSGHPLTVIINCIVNSLYMRYAFYLTTGKKPSEFKKFVRLATYGDDNGMGVSKDCPLFNHTRISVALKLIGVVYTMADKEAESVPYIHIDDVSFLKRKFRYDADVGAVLAPLDSSSFDKMLTSYLDTGTLAPQAHSICVIETAIREYFFYGKEIFEQKRAMFKKMVEDCKLTDWVRDSTFPTYNQLAYDFWMRFDNHAMAKRFN